MAVATIEQPPVTVGSYRGTMTKRIIDMSPSEQEAYYQDAAIKVREQLFAIGQPLVYKKNGQVIAEYGNGKIEIIH